MQKKYCIFLILALCGVVNLYSQTIYSEPSPLQLDSKDVKIYFNATGTPLEGLNAADKVYAHTGYGESWTNAPTWGTNTDKYLLTNQGGNLWMLYIGDIRTYYAIPSSVTTINELNFVFRNANCNVQTGNLSIPVKEEGLQIELSTNLNGNVMTPESAYVTFTVNVTETAEINLYVNSELIASNKNVSSLKKQHLFEAPGTYKIEATAIAANDTKSTSLILNYLPDAVEKEYPGGTPKMGPVKNTDGSVTFCLGAPEKEHVLLVGSWNNYEYSPSQVMNYQDTDNGRYFWTTVTGLDNDQMYVYYYMIDGGEYIVGDPYARLVLDPLYDEDKITGTFKNLPPYPIDAIGSATVPVGIYQGSINDYKWQIEEFEAPDPSNLIIYELLFRDFTGTEGKALGDGTVKMAIEKIPYLKQLGVNAIEVLPIYEFNGNVSWGYNPNFYFAPDKAYGTPDDYKEFIDACHQNGMAVILDMVFNQTDGRHPWFQMYEVGKNPFYNLDAPHAYSVLNDWNQGMPMVQEQWADVLTYWLTEYKFDGFRFDLVKGLGLNDSYGSNSDYNTNKYNASRVAEMLYLQSVIQKVNPKAYFINENLATPQEENEMSEKSMAEYGNMQMNWANKNDAACQFAMGYSDRSNLNPLYAVEDSRIWGSTVSYLESHDEQRLAYTQNQWGNSGVKGNVETSMKRIGSAAAQMILSPGAHMIWQFSELGNDQNTKNSNGGNNTDPKIVNWDLLNEPNHKGLYDSYSELINIRLSNPELFSKNSNFTISCNSSNWATGRYLYSYNDEKELLTVINPNTAGSPLTLKWDFKNKNNAAYKIMSKSYNSSPTFDAEGGTVTVPINSYIVIGSVNVSADVEGIEADNTSDNLKVYGGIGEIVVNYAKEGAAVYSIEGKKIGVTGTAGIITASPGIYIVTSGNHSTKVIVK